MITKEDFQTEIMRLADAMDGRWKKERQQACYEQIRQHDLKYLQGAVNTIISSCDRMPTIAYLIKTMNSMRFNDWDQQKLEYDEKAKQFMSGRLVSSEFGIECCKKVIAVMNGEMSLADLYQEMLVLEKTNPGVGWKAEANKIFHLLEVPF